MKFVCSILAVVSSLSLVSAAPNELSDAEKSEGFVSLFDGKSLDGWRGFRKDKPSDGWQVVDGAITLTKGGAGDLVSEKAFADFDLRLQFKIAPQGNSGVMFRVSEDKKYPATYSTGPEYQILDPNGQENYGHEIKAGNVSGGLYGIVPSKPEFSKPAGEWNDARIFLKDNHLKMFINGKKTVDVVLGSDEYKELLGKSKFASWDGFGKMPIGKITFQDHGQEVAFRNIRIKSFE